MKSLLASLQISPDTLAARGLVLHPEATALEVAETGADGREHLLTPAAAAFEWLSRNAERFGFFLSYPRDNPYGYAYEPWHWCFRG